MRFRDRVDAGERLAELLSHTGIARPAVVLGLPRGGVLVADPVAGRLGLPLDVLVIRKLGAPGHAEFALGAIGEGGVRVLDSDSVRGLRVSEPKLAAVESAETLELKRRTELYRAGLPPLDLTGVTALLIDDGVATGATGRAACLVSRALGAARVVLAVPVAAPDWTGRLGDVADELIALSTPTPFSAVGRWYERFGQTSDDEVLDVLRRHGPRHPPGPEERSGRGGSHPPRG